MKKGLLFITLPVFIMWACDNDKLKIDTSKVEVPQIQTLRLEQDLFAINEKDFEKQSAAMRNKYGVFYDHFLMNPIGVRGSQDTSSRAALLAFTSDRELREAYSGSQKLYSNMDAFTAEIEQMSKRFHYHFPQSKLPAKFITTISGWNYSVAYMDSALILSLDMYLGDTCRLYQMLRYPQYQTRKMNADHILPDLARGWILTEMDTVKPENTLLHHTIFYGKIFYCVSALLPETPDSLLIGYSAQQMQTCKQYEKQYWSYFAEKNRLYENSLQNIRELTTDGPFTAAISKECPPRIAMWIGWQIVKSYMKHNENVSVEELMKEKDVQKILNKSKYRP